jgi:hypothetical protein
MRRCESADFEMEGSEISDWKQCGRFTCDRTVLTITTLLIDMRTYRQKLERIPSASPVKFSFISLEGSVVDAEEGVSG